MLAVTRTLTVAQPVEKVADYLTDFANALDWDPGTVSCVRVDEGPVQVGSRWVNTSRFMGATAVLDYRLALREPDRLVFEGRNDSATSRDDLRLKAIPDGGTHIAYHAEISFSGLLRFADPLLRRRFERLADRVAACMGEAINGL